MISLIETNIFAKWLSNLKDDKTRFIILKRLDRLILEHFGDVESVGDGVFELRIHYGSGWRIYCHQKGKTIIVLLCGGNKSSQKKDIERAKKLVLDLSIE